MQGSIITVEDPSKCCQTGARKTKALDVQMLNASNDLDSSTTVSRCCITLHLNANLETTEFAILRVGKEFFLFVLEYQSCSFPSS